MSFIYHCQECFSCKIVWPLTLLFTGASHFLLQNHRVDLHSAFTLANVHECLVNFFGFSCFFHLQEMSFLSCARLKLGLGMTWLTDRTCLHK
jgi:hypothetical protein